MCLIKIQNPPLKILFNKQAPKTPKTLKKPKKKLITIPVKVVFKIAKLKHLNQLFFKNFHIISNLLLGILNPLNKIFIKTINYNYTVYWTLFGYNTEKYYILKNSYLPKTEAIFLKIGTINTSKQFAISNIIGLKKTSVGFNIPEKNYKGCVDSFLRSNNFENQTRIKSRFGIFKSFKYEEEVDDVNMWTENNFKYKTKLLLTNQRKILCEFFQKKLKRQYRITPWISNFLKWKSKSIVNFFDLLLINVLLNSKLVLNFKQAVWFIEHGFVYVNGTVSTKTNHFLKKMDVIQIVFSGTYITSYAHHFNYLFKANNKFINKFSRKISENEDWDIGYYLSRRSRIPKIFQRASLFKQSIPPYLEVDFLTLSVIIIYVPFGFNFTLNSNYNHYNYYLARLYNWKFRS